MSNELRDLDSLLPLPPASFHILRVLAQGESHGYRIMQEIEKDTQGSFRVWPGTLYSSIKRMVNAGWIEETEKRPDSALDDERRRYYRLTDMGLKVTQAEAKRLAGLVRLARDAELLSGPASAPSAKGTSRP